MGVTVTFDYAAWVARYPEFTSVPEPLAAQYFAEATAFHANDGTGPVNSATLQRVYLNMVTAHIAARYAVRDGKQPSDLVGKIQSASEGSVSVSVESDSGPSAGSHAWYTQTKYGNDYLAATAQYRGPLYRKPAGRRVSTSGARTW